MSSSSRKWRFNGNTRSTEVITGVSLYGKTIAITGTTNGIGIETARAIALAGGHVVMFIRNVAAGEELKQKILTEKPDASIDIIKCNLSELASVKVAADEFHSKAWPLHVLILNAGIVGKQDPALSTDNYEMTFAVNHLAQFYLTTLLLDILKSSAPSRVVVVSSESHRRGPGIDKNITADTLNDKTLTTPLGQNLVQSMTHYGKSKMCNVWFANALDRKYKEDGIRAYSLHPGSAISTSWYCIIWAKSQQNINIAKDWISKAFLLLAKPFTKSLEQGAATSVFCAVAPELADMGGMYFRDCRAVDPHPLGLDVHCQDKLWQISDELIKRAQAA